MLPCVLDPKSAAPKKPIRAYTTKAIPVTCTPNLQHDAPLPVLGLHACVKMQAIQYTTVAAMPQVNASTVQCDHLVQVVLRQQLCTKVEVENVSQGKHNVWICQCVMTDRKAFL